MASADGYDYQADKDAHRARSPDQPAALIWDAGEDDARIAPRRWLLGMSFCRGFVSSVVAQGGTGKTSLRIVQALAMATGRKLTDEFVFHRSRVLLISLEDDRDELRRRVRAAMKHFDIELADVKGWLFLATPRGMKLAEVVGAEVVPGPLAGFIREQVEARKIDVVSIDPFVKCHGVEENDNGAVDKVITIMAGLAAELGIAIDAPHHVSKGPADPGNSDKGRGASALRDGARLSFTLSEMSQEEAEQLGIATEKRRSFVRLDPAKVNLAPKAGSAKWFELVSVALSNGTDAYPDGDNIQVIEPWQPPDMWENLPNAVVNAILDDIVRGMDDGRQYSGNQRATTRAAWVVVRRHAPELNEKQCRAAIKTWLSNGVLIEAPYVNPKRRNPESGLTVNAMKRPS